VDVTSDGKRLKTAKSFLSKALRIARDTALAPTDALHEPPTLRGWA
jgi:hypothetical protein